MNMDRNDFREVCLACGETIFIKKPVMIGQIVNCGYCRAQFEIVELDPLYLDWPYYTEDYIEEEYFEGEEY
jgi:lysine biosynthesis protein LysW